MDTANIYIYILAAIHNNNFYRRYYVYLAHLSTFTSYALVKFQSHNY